MQEMSAEALTIEIPKLPQLNEEDVKAVRSFLPGKVLGRTAAFLSLLLMILGFSGAIGIGLKKFLNVELPLWAYGILIGLSLLAVVAQVVVEWLAARHGGGRKARHVLQPVWTSSVRQSRKEPSQGAVSLGEWL